MSFTQILKDAASSFIRGGIVEEVKHTVRETMDDVEKKATKIVNNTVKSLIVVFIVMLGSIFALVGLSKYLSETVTGLGNGLGFIVVGGVLIILAAFAKLMRKE